MSWSSGRVRPDTRAASNASDVIAVRVVTIQVALQPVFAGPLLEGNATARDLYALNGVLIELTAIVLLITSILAWRLGRAPSRVAVTGGLMFVVLIAGAASGHARAFNMAGALNVHVPLGVALMVLMLWLLLSTRSLRPVPRAASRGE